MNGWKSLLKIIYEIKIITKTKCVGKKKISCCWFMLNECESGDVKRTETERNMWAIIHFDEILVLRWKSLLFLVTHMFCLYNKILFWKISPCEICLKSRRKSHECTDFWIFLV